MIPCRKRHSERGQAILLVVVAMGIVLLGALGFAIDGSQLFAQRRMAQAAADAAAQAGIMSMLDGTDAAVSVQNYAQLNGFDPPTVEFPSSVAGVPNGISFIKVTVQRTVPTTLMKLLGTSASTIGATATAAIVRTTAAAPQIIVTANVAGAFTLASGAELTVEGGANRVVQVNSDNPDALSASGGTVDLTQAGLPDANGVYHGADFAVWRGPSTAPFTLLPSAERYVEPGSPMQDAASYVSSPPTNVPTLQPAIPLDNGSNGCPGAPIMPCKLYSPGIYTTDIDITDQTAVFKPGVYEMQGVNFHLGTNGYMVMATGFTDSSTGAGMLVYSTGAGAINLSGTGSSSLASPTIGTYRGIQFVANTLQLSGSPSLSLTGSIIVGTLSVSGTPTISFLPSSPTPAYPVKQVALVN